MSEDSFFISSGRVELYIPLILKVLSTSITCSVWRKSELSLVKSKFWDFNN